MPVQTQMSSFAKKLGGRVAQANAEHKDKPIDTGMQQLPPGIKNGVAKISSCYTKEYADDKNGPGTKGQVFFRASAVIVSPLEHDGQKTAGSVTSMVIPLCDMPAKGKRKASTFSENWFEFQNLFKLLGIMPPNENGQTDPTGTRTEAYYYAAMKTLVDPARPVHVTFSTRGWTPAATPAQPKPTEMVFEDWHGVAQWNGQHAPASGMADSTDTQPAPMEAPPTGAVPQTASQQGGAPPPTTGQNPQYQPDGPVDPADEVAALVETALNDPEGATEEGAAASARLEELAWAAGATEEQTTGAADWGVVAEMALGIMPAPTAPTEPPPSQATSKFVVVGGKHKFAKRTKDGAKLKNAKNEEFPPQDVEVTSVDMAGGTCTVKSLKDGKDVCDLKTKKPIAVKFTWLE